MSSKIGAQDFEAYAAHKSMVGVVSSHWRHHFREVRWPAGRPATILDFGCGDGRFLDEYLEASDHDHVHGVEVSERRVIRARERGYRHVLRVDPGAALPYADDQFDFINMSEVIEHIPAAVVGAILRDLGRVLKPTGVAFVSTPNYPVKRLYDVIDAVRHGKWARLRDDPTHVAQYNAASLRQTLGAHFSTVRVVVLKEGVLYRRLARRPGFMHKLLAICTDPQRRPAG